MHRGFILQSTYRIEAGKPGEVKISYRFLVSFLFACWRWHQGAVHGGPPGNQRPACPPEVQGRKVALAGDFSREDLARMSSMGR